MKEGQSDKLYDFSYQSLSKGYPSALSPNKQQTHLMERLALAGMSSIFGHLSLFILQGNSGADQINLLSRFKLNLISTFRGMELNLITFGGKVLIDYFGLSQSEYTKGGIVGLLGYILNRPLDQIYTVQKTISLNEKKLIGRAQACRVILKYDGIKGFYKYENILAPLSSIIHRSTYFGLNHRLSTSTFPHSNYLCQFALLPLIASIGASSTTFFIDKLRSVYLQVHHLKDTAILKRNKISLHESLFVTRQILNMINKGEIKIVKKDFVSVSISISKNWVFLSLFMIGQTNRTIEMLRGEN